MNSTDKQIKQNSQKVWGATPAGSYYGNDKERGSREFFEQVLKRRFTEECDWMNEIVNFSQFKNKKVLEIGCGAGYDAYMFCKNGVDYTGIDITPENEVLAKKHLEYYGYNPKVMQMDVEEMPFKEEFDFVFSFGVLHHTPNIEKALKNIYKALKPGGKTQIIVYNKYSIAYIYSTILNQWILKGGFFKRSLAKQRSLIEGTESDALPLVNVYSRHQIENLIKKTGLKLEKTKIRKFAREDIPLGRPLKKITDHISDNTLKKIGKKLGWYVSVIARK